MFHRAMDRTVPRFIPPLPDSGDQNKYKELSDRRPVIAQTRSSGSGLSKNDNTSRPCAIIGPDGIAPQYRKLDGYPPHVWPQARNGAVSYYRPAPAQYYGEQIYPPRNISPRHTFQENMSRFIVPSPAEIKVRNDGYLTANNQNCNFVMPNGAKRNISPSVKFCEGAVLVPHSVEVLRPQYHKGESPTGRLDVQGPPLSQLTTHSIPVTNVHEMPYTHTNNLYAYNTEFQRYPHEYQNHGIHVVKSNPAYQTYPEQQSPYYIANEYSGNPYARVNGVRYEPYPPSKDKYVHARYDYSYQVSNEYAAAHGSAQKLHEPRKKLPPPPTDVRYYPVPQKYIETHPHIAESEYRTKISNRKNPNGVPYVTDVPNYPADRYANQAKIFEFNFYDKNSQIAGDPRPVAESTKIKIDYYNHCKNLPYPDVHYSNDNSHNLSHSKGSMSVYNYPMRPPEVYHPYSFNGNYHKPVETHNIDQKPYYNPLAKIPTEFSPNIISPTESNASFDSSNTVSHQQYQEDGGYVSQCSTASGQSIDYLPNGNVKNYDRIYNAMPGRPTNPYAASFIPQNNCIEVKQMKSQNVNKCSIDLRQFVEMWDEEFEDQTQAKTLPETFAQKNIHSSLPQAEMNCLPASEELYVLDKVTISQDDLHKYEHIQKVTKLPDNIKDFEQMEIAKRNRNTKNITAHSTACVSAASKLDNFNDCNQNEPIDVEAKITQSIIHKEVGCNFEIKPCSPGKQVLMASANMSVNQKIDKNRDCHNGDMKNSRSEMIVNHHNMRDKNTPNIEILHNINFFGEVKNTTKTARENDLLQKNKPQPAGSSLPQIEIDDAHVIKIPSNNSINTGLGTDKFESSPNQTELLKLKEKSKLSFVKIDINETSTPVEKEPSKKKSFAKTHITETKSQTLNQSSFTEHFMLPVCGDLNSYQRNPTVIKSNYGRKSFSPIDRIEIQSNKISEMAATEKSIDLSGKTEKDKGNCVGEENNEIAHLHIPDIPEIIADTNELDKVAVSAVMLSNTDSSKVIHTTLERVMEAIESNIESDLAVIPVTLQSDVDHVADYPDLAMDYTSASLDQEAIINLQVNLKEVISSSPVDVHPKITETNEISNIEEKDVIPASSSSEYQLVEPTIEVQKREREGEKKECLVKKEVIDSLVCVSDKILAPLETWNISPKSPMLKISQRLDSDIAIIDIPKHPRTLMATVDNPSLFEMPLSNSCNESLIIPVNDDEILYSSSNCESSSINLNHDLSMNEHSGCGIISNRVDHDQSLLPLNKDTFLCSGVATVEPSDEPLILPIADSKSIVADTLSQTETHITEQIDNGDNAMVFEVDLITEKSQVCKDLPVDDDNVEIQNLETKLTHLNDENSHPTTLNQDEDEFDTSSSDSSQSNTDTSESTSSDDTVSNSEENTSIIVSNETDDSNSKKDIFLKNTMHENIISSRRQSVSISAEQKSVDVELTANSNLFENSVSQEKIAGIPYSSPESWNINHSICDDIQKLKCPSTNENNTFGSQSVDDYNTNNLLKPSEGTIDAISSLPVSNNSHTSYDCNDQVVTDVMICSNSYSKCDDSVDEKLVMRTAQIEEECNLYNCEDAIYVGVQDEDEDGPNTEDDNILVLANDTGYSEALPVEPNLYNVITSDPTLNEDIYRSSESEISSGEITTQDVEISKIEHDGLELGGCWIDDIACVETVVSEEVNFPHEITETTIDSTQSWDPNSSDDDDDDNISHMLHYHIDSVGNILKDTNGNVILTNPLFEISKDLKKKTTKNKNNDDNKNWKCDNLKKYTKGGNLPIPKIDIPTPKDSDAKKSLKAIKLPGKQKRKSSCSQDQRNKQDISNKSKQRKQSMDSEINEIKQKSVRKIDTDEKERNNYDTEKDTLQGAQPNHHSGRRVLTKGAQKYIPPIATDDLKVYLPLPEKKLLSLIKLNSPAKSTSNDTAKNAKEDFSNIKRMVLPKKKPKPKFEDVLKSIETSTMSWSKKRAIKFRQTVPKMVIKKNKHGSHYASLNTEKASSPDMTGSKWQPLVSIWRDACIEKMILNKETQTVYCNVVCSPRKIYTQRLKLTADKQKLIRNLKIP